MGKPETVVLQYKFNDGRVFKGSIWNDADLHKKTGSIIKNEWSIIGRKNQTSQESKRKKIIEALLLIIIIAGLAAFIILIYDINFSPGTKKTSAPRFEVPQPFDGKKFAALNPYFPAELPIKSVSLFFTVYQGASPHRQFILAKNERKDFALAKKMLQKNYQLTNFKLHTFIIPEGEYAYDKEQAGSYFIRDHILLNVQSKSYRERLKSICMIECTEDWAGYMQALENWDNPAKEVVKKVINDQTSFIQRIQAMRDMAVIYADISEITASLNRTEVSMKFSNKFQDSLIDIESAIIKSPGVFFPDEILWITKQEPSKEKQKELYKKALTIYPEDWRIANNLACLLFDLNDFFGARNLLKNAQNHANNPDDKERIKNNMKIVDTEIADQLK